MGDAQLHTSSSTTLDTLHERPDSPQRARPPDFDVSLHEHILPHRADRSNKKESKIGLRGLFTRSKTGKLDKDTEGSSIRPASRSASIRASLADFGTWPYRHSSRSEASLPSIAPANPRSIPVNLFNPPRPPQTSHSGVVAAPWNPPPLFQVYPQAVKHATLPYYNVSVEALARYSGKGVGKPVQETGIATPEKFKENTLKKRQRLGSFRHSGEWTSKIFILVTSGYLLQYAAEGTYNRVPEKVLQLTATSAAYASDLIPGRHWVLQVASTTDANGNTVVDSGSRRSRLSMRDNGRVANMLLVFENPEAMDNWLAILRREIEIHGGKRRMSETGNVEVDEPAPSEIRETDNQRPIIVGDPTRFSHVITRDFSYTPENHNDLVGNDFAISSPRRFSAYTIDNTSEVASMISYDGQRLDNLRDSSSTHRFSYISSGQRTMITSEGSSPACSPTRVSFSSQGEDLQPLPSMPEIRLRPNAAAIVNRRQSMQALISSFEAPIEHGTRPHANSTSTFSQEYEEHNAPSVPNFSVPHTVNKRFSLNTSTPHALDHDRNSKPSRRTPPTALLMSRPLSIVIDQPSPRSPCSPNSLSRSVDSCRSIPPELSNAAATFDSSQSIPSQPIVASQADGAAYEQINSSPRVDFATGVDNARTDNHTPEASSPLNSYNTRRQLSGALSKLNSPKRSSLVGESRSFQNTPYPLANVDEREPIPTNQASLEVQSSYSPKRSAPSPQGLVTIDSQEKLITSRKSMPQLNDGPPVGPPPSYALPPIPRKPSARHYNTKD